MGRFALAVGSLLVGLTLAGPTMAGDFSRYLDLDDEIELPVSRAQIRKMLKNPEDAIGDLKKALGSSGELGEVDRMLKSPGKVDRAKTRERKAVVKSSQDVERQPTEEVPNERVKIEEIAPGVRAKAQNVNCTKFVPSAGTTIAIDCGE